MTDLPAHARSIWDAGVAAVAPGRLVASALESLPAEIQHDLETAPRIIVVGAGKAGAAMAVAVERCLPNRTLGIVNVPEGFTERTTSIRLNAARPVGSNFPTQAGVEGAWEMLGLLEIAGPEDVALCLISGGGSALLPCPSHGITLEDKQSLTRQLHASGATICEMNTVRKHLSCVKGGQLAKGFRGKRLISLIISDVVGDPLDVIASGPTSPDPTTFADCLAILDRCGLTERAPANVMHVLRRGLRHPEYETPKSLPDTITNVVIGSNGTALAAAKRTAESLGYRVLDLGPFIEGETVPVAAAIAGIVKSIQRRQEPLAPPACILIGGETTVTLGPKPGKGGRNQEFTLAMLHHLGQAGMKNVCVLSGGTDGEDGPTDAAGAIGTENSFPNRSMSLSISDSLARHDAYPFFDQMGGLIRTGLTGTNVMDLRIILIGNSTM
ncbi:MAG: DUF4147 domain-containing protein [Gemmataceae bacterium]